MPQKAKKPQHGHKAKHRSTTPRPQARAGITKATSHAGAAKATEHVVQDGTWVPQPAGTYNKSRRASKMSPGAAPTPVPCCAASTGADGKFRAASGSSTSRARDGSPSSPGARASTAKRARKAPPTPPNPARLASEAAEAAAAVRAKEAERRALGSQVQTRQSAQAAARKLQAERAVLDAQIARYQALVEEKRDEILELLSDPVRAFDWRAFWELAMHEFAVVTCTDHRGITLSVTHRCNTHLLVLCVIQGVTHISSRSNSVMQPWARSDHARYTPDARYMTNKRLQIAHARLHATSTDTRAYARLN